MVGVDFDTKSLRYWREQNRLIVTGRPDAVDRLHAAIINACAID